MAQPAWHQPQLVQAGRPLYSVLLMEVGIGASGMPCALKASLKTVAVPEGLQRRHRIVLGDREPAPLLRRVAGDADVFGDAVVVGREVVIGDRPVEPAAVLALHPEIARMQPRPVGVEVQHRAAGAPAGVRAVAGIVPAGELEARRMLEALRPHLRADELLHVPVGAELEHHDLLAGARQHVGEHRPGGAGADDHDVDFFLRCHVTTSGCDEPSGRKSGQTSSVRKGAALAA